jgi:zinc D-Ala-D-Ala carboxypeptidase
MPTMLSPNFSLEEMTLSQTAQRMGMDNTPTPEARAGLDTLAATMEKVRTILGDKPIMISSGYRSPAVNAACGGSSTSAHMSGLAADFTCPAFGTPLDICNKLEPHMADLAIDQLIWEYNGWVHLGLTDGDPRCMAMTINENGTNTGFA